MGILSKNSTPTQSCTQNQTNPNEGRSTKYNTGLLLNGETEVSFYFKEHIFSSLPDTENYASGNSLVLCFQTGQWKPEQRDRTPSLSICAASRWGEHSPLLLLQRDKRALRGERFKRASYAHLFSSHIAESTRLVPINVGGLEITIATQGKRVIKLIQVPSYNQVYKDLSQGGRMHWDGSHIVSVSQKFSCLTHKSTRSIPTQGIFVSLPHV